MHRVAGGLLFQRFQASGHLFLVFPFAQFAVDFSGVLKEPPVVLRDRAFRHGHNAEALAFLEPVEDCTGDCLLVVGDFWNENHICPAGQTGSQCQPAGFPPHNLDDDNAVVAVSRAVQAVDRFRRDAGGAVISDRGVGFDDVVVDGQRHGQHPDATL